MVIINYSLDVIYLYSYGQGREEGGEGEQFSWAPGTRRVPPQLSACHKQMQNDAYLKAHVLLCKLFTPAVNRSKTIIS